MDQLFATGLPFSFFGANAFEQMRTKPGINHVWSFAAASAIVRNYTQCPQRLRKKNDLKGLDLIDEDPLLDLLANPNPHMNGTNIMEAIAWLILLPTARGPGGQAFMWGDTNTNFRKGNLPKELWVQSDNGVRPLLNPQKILTGWGFTNSESSPYDYGQMTLNTQQVIRINTLNPYDFLKGVSPGYPLRANVDQDAGAMEFTTNFIKNHPSMPGVFTSKKFLNQGQVDEFKASLAKYMAGPKNAGMPGVLPLELDYQQLGLSEDDFSHLNLLGWTRDATLAVYHVSKFAVEQYEDLNYATAKEADRQLFKAAIKPLDAMIMSQINAAWVKWYGKGDLVLCTDFANIDALKDEMDARVARSKILHDMGIPAYIALKMCQVPVDELDPKLQPWLLEDGSPNSALNNALNDDGGDGDPEKKPGAKKTAILV